MLADVDVAVRFRAVRFADLYGVLRELDDSDNEDVFFRLEDDGDDDEDDTDEPTVRDDVDEVFVFWLFCCFFFGRYL